MRDAVHLRVLLEAAGAKPPLSNVDLHGHCLSQANTAILDALFRSVRQMQVNGPAVADAVLWLVMPVALTLKY